MRSIAAAALALVVLINGCGPRRMDMEWTLNNQPDAKFCQDRYECIQRHDSDQKFQACMEARGYTRVK